ncbi:MAG: hypothetical protein WC454_09155 [Phycisphaerae bacterium]|jgi:prophage DNA circulation protein
MSLSLIKTYMKSEYEKDLESSVNTQLSSISSNVTTLSGNITTLSGNVTTLSGNVTTLSGNVTSILDFAPVTANDTASFTLSLATYRNFLVTNASTTGKTFLISSASTATDSMINVNVKMTFTTTATITYTGTITWNTTAPNPTAAGTFLINLKSFDAGANWYGSYAGLY